MTFMDGAAGWDYAPPAPDAARQALGAIGATLDRVNVPNEHDFDPEDINQREAMTTAERVEWLARRRPRRETDAKPAQWALDFVRRVEVLHGCESGDGTDPTHADAEFMFGVLKLQLALNKRSSDAYTKQLARADNLAEVIERLGAELRGNK